MLNWVTMTKGLRWDDEAAVTILSMLGDEQDDGELSWALI